MAAEMERLKMEEKRDAKMRQQIRESRYIAFEICCCQSCAFFLLFL